MINPEADLTTTYRKYFCLELFSLTHTATQLGKIWADNSSSFLPVPKGNNDLLIPILKSYIEEVTDS
ncbi:hypothetical protein ASV19_08655 [Enterobacter cloacae subsp. cloacae]|nr:hypothetical protein ASV19_08655 [Enterobacter cloacae subsp. cloacae]KVJ35641.1 hypothetical protein AWS33_21680 [Enterobacter cloacae subsp. cloacae]